MMAKWRVWLVFTGLMVSGTVVAEPLKIGLALSGGGARGMAHVGVLKVLEREGLRVDYIAGTSMGSIVGGLYASGLSPEDIERELHAMDWDSVFEDKDHRAKRSFRRKQDDRLFLAKGRVGVKQGELNVSTALIQGQKFDLELNRLTQHVAGIRDFDDLPIPFRAVATDLTTGREVVLGEGNLPLSLRASMSVPAAFAGVEIDGRLLVDGGMANNLPISVVRDMGADVIIAVDISSPLLEREELGSVLGVLNQLSGFLTRRNTERQIATLTERDILLVPDLGDITSASFTEVSAAIRAGMLAAEAQRDKFARLAMPHRSRLAKTDLPSPTRELRHLHIDNDSRISEEVLRRKLRIQPGEKLDREALEQGISRIYSMGIFESVRYELTEHDGEQGVLVRVKEKSWGTDFLQFGLEASSSTGAGGSFFNLSAGFTKQPLNALNGEWRTIVQLGEEPRITSELYQPLNSDSGYFLHGILEYGDRLFRIFDGTQSRGEYRTTELRLDLGAGINLDNWGELRLGYRGYDGDVDLVTGSGLLPERQYTGGEVYARFAVDELDSLYFPRQGHSLRLEALYSREYLGADQDFEQLFGRGVWANSSADHTLILAGELGGSRAGAAPLQNRFRLGGFLRLSGMEPYQLTGQYVALIEAVYMHRLYRSNLVPAYAGASIEAGNTWNSSRAIALDDLFWAGSAFLGVDTPVGPVYLAYGYAETGQSGFYLFIGQAWAR